MTQLYLTRFAQSKFGKLPEMTVDEMIERAGRDGLEDVNREAVDHVAIAGLLTPMLNDQCLLAGIVAMDPAYRNKSIKGLGNACDSGSLAVVDCVAQILSGQAHVGLAVGLEKMNPVEGKLDSKMVGAALGTAAHREDRFPPLTFPHAFATIMDRYMKAYDLTEEDFACIPPIFYDNASKNPLAHMYTTKEPVTPEAVLGSYRLFRDPPLPLKLFECSQISDGWARILVCDDEGLASLGLDKSEVTRLEGWGVAVDSLSIASRGEDLIRPVGARKAFHHAMDMAGASPADICFQEIHDCFSIMGPIAAETTGQAEVGRGVAYFQEGRASLDGSCPLNTSGGLIAKGHPISATGIAMIGWVHNQILGKAPAALQLDRTDLATTLNIGGPICSTVVTVQRPG